MAKVEAAFVRQELGELDDLEIARIVALGPSEAEVLEARAWLDGDETVSRKLGKPSTGIVAQIVDIAREALEAETEDEPV